MLLCHKLLGLRDKLGRIMNLFTDLFMWVSGKGYLKNASIIHFHLDPIRQCIQGQEVLASEKVGNVLSRLCTHQDEVFVLGVMLAFDDEKVFDEPDPYLMLCKVRH